MPEEGSKPGKKFKGNRGQAEGPGDVRAICFSRGERIQYYSTAWGSLHRQMMQKEKFFDHLRTGHNSTTFSSRDAPRRCADLSFTPISARSAESYTEVPFGHTIMPGGTTLERRQSFLDRRTPRLGLMHQAYTRKAVPSNKFPETFYDERPTPIEPITTANKRASTEGATTANKGNEEEPASPKTPLEHRQSLLAAAASSPQRGSVGGHRASITANMGGSHRASISAVPRASLLGDLNAAPPAAPEK